MGAVPDKYILVKEGNNNVTMIGYAGINEVERYSLNPAKDIRISQSFPGSIIIPVNSLGNHVDNKFVSIPWERIDFANSTPSSTVTTIFEAVEALGRDFFFELGGGGGCLEGTNYIIVCADGTPVENAAELQAAYTAAVGMSPSASNRITIIAKPGYYDFGNTTFVMNTDYISLVSLTGNKDVIFNSTDPLGTIDVSAQRMLIKGIDVGTKQFFLRTGSNQRIENCRGGNYSFGSGEVLFGTFINCIAGVESFGGGFGGEANGVYKDCIGGNGSFGGSFGISAGTFINCTGGFDSFGGGYGTSSGIYTNCEGGNGAFGGQGQASGTYTNCKGGDYSFAGLGVASGVFTECIGGNYSFAGDNGLASGTFTRCEGLDYSFAGKGGLANGVFTNCKGADYSFGEQGVAEGTFSYCEGGSYSFGFDGATGAGIFLNCRGGLASFAAAGIASGIFINCVGRNNSFGASGTASGTFTNCISDSLSFGSFGAASGVFNHCQGGDGSFGGYNTASGDFTNCIGGDTSFGGNFPLSGILTGKLYYCRLTSGTFETVSGGGRTIYCIDGNNNTNNQ